MDFNPTKTKMVIFSNKNVKSKPKIQLKGEQIEQVSSHKHLGVFLSQDMKWTTHIDYSIKRVKKKLGLLRRQSCNLLNRQKIDIYKTIIRPVIEYGSVFTPSNHFHDDFFGKLLTQIKLKLSPLNAQLFEYNLTENPFCAACGDSIETPLISSPNALHTNHIANLFYTTY